MGGLVGDLVRGKFGGGDVFSFFFGGSGGWVVVVFLGIGV